jgi:hypothetical protein
MHRLHDLGHKFVIGRITFQAKRRDFGQIVASWSSCRQVSRENVGKTRLALKHHILWLLTKPSATGRDHGRSFTHSDLLVPTNAGNFKRFPTNFLLLSINSHGIPIPMMSREGATEPHTPKQVSYRHPSSDEEIRRASEQTSPQVARAVGHTQRWDRAADWAVAAAQSAVFT